MSKPFKLPKMPAVPHADRVATFLNSRNTREKYMLVAFIGVFIFTLDYFLWLAPVLKLYSASAPHIASLREERRTMKEDIKNKEAILAKWESTKKDLAEKEAMFIAPDETPALLENLSKQAQRSGVRITSLEPSDAPTGGEPKRGHTPLPIKLQAMAGTHEFGAFLSNLETGRTFFRVTDMRITADPATSERKHTVQLSMEAYKRDK